MFQAAGKKGNILSGCLLERLSATSCTKRVRHTNLKKQGIRLSSARLYNAHLLNFFHVSGRAKKKGNILSFYAFSTTSIGNKLYQGEIYIYSPFVLQ